MAQRHFLLFSAIVQCPMPFVGQSLARPLILWTNLPSQVMPPPPGPPVCLSTALLNLPIFCHPHFWPHSFAGYTTSHSCHLWAWRLCYSCLPSIQERPPSLDLGWTSTQFSTSNSALGNSKDRLRITFERIGCVVEGVHIWRKSVGDCHFVWEESTTDVQW